MLYLGHYSLESFASSHPLAKCLHGGDHFNYVFGYCKFFSSPEHLEDLYVWSNSFNFIVSFITLLRMDLGLKIKIKFIIVNKKTIF